MSDKNHIPLDIDLDATISGPIGNLNPDRIAALKNASADDADPEITIAPPPKAVDPDATFSGPLTEFDPDATISNPGGGRRRSNPFAPKALPEALQANLAGLGGLNPLVAFANPILSAVPQIAAARNHPDPVRLKETLQDLIEAFEAGASKAGVGDDALEGAVYALCCLADDAAASTPWGRDWTTKGLLHELRGETKGGHEFFELLEETKQKPDDKANLLEFLYICLALGFQGRFRKQGDAGSQADPQLDRIRADLHAVISRRRPRPSGGLSERWRGASPAELPKKGGSARASRPGKSVVWRAAGAVGVALLLIVAGYKLMSPATPPDRSAVATPPRTTLPGPASPVAVMVSQPPVPTPAVRTPTLREAIEKDLAAEIERGLLAVSESGDRSSISIRDDRQFASGTIQPTAAVQAVVGRIADAVGRTQAHILVRGYADSTPVKPAQFASNKDLSAARAKAVADFMAAKLGARQRVSSEGVGEADPIAPNDTEANRAKNRRISIIVGPQT